MGVAGLWDVLRPAAKTRSLTELAVVEGFQNNRDGLRGFRIGIDASIWFFHAEYGREGENPVLRTLFFRCASLMRSPFLPLFVFDGPRRPDIKRGKKINKTSHKLIPGMKQIVEAFGFEWRTAPGEAEAELAYLNSVGVIDGVLSDDVDNFLFGALTVIRNSSNNLSGNRSNPTLNSSGKDDKNHTRVYHLCDITDHPDIQLSRGGMILIGLMSGGDYEQGGLTRCGIVTSHGLAKCGFGDKLYQAAKSMDREELQQFLVGWRRDLIEELRTNSRGYIGRKQPALANSFPDTFPNIDILLSYVNPVTSESMGRNINIFRPNWAKELDIAKVAAVCEFYFEWGYKEAILKRFRTVLWHSAVMRILRRSAIDFDGSGSVKSTSQLIAQYFSSAAIDNTSSLDTEVNDEPLIVKIHSSRNHSSTDGLLEYRLEIAPLQLAHMAASGIKGIRAPEGPDEWAFESDGEDDEGKKSKVPPEPNTHMRIWVPACMAEIAEMQLVKEFQEKASRKNNPKKRSTNTKTKIVKVGNVHSERALKPVAPSQRRNNTRVVRIQSESSSDRELDLNLSDAEVSLTPSQPSSVLPKMLKGKSVVRDLTKGNSKLKGSGPGIQSHFRTAKRSAPIFSQSDYSTADRLTICLSEETNSVMTARNDVNNRSTAPCMLETANHEALSPAEICLAPFPLSSDLHGGADTMPADASVKDLKRQRLKPSTSCTDQVRLNDSVASQPSQSTASRRREAVPLKNMTVIEISSSSDSDNVGTTTKKVPPLLRARSRKKESDGGSRF